jgi:Zn-dependent peptidase ImmA (M78 family)
MTARDRDMALAAGSEAVALDQWVDGQFRRPDPNIPDLRGVDPESAAEILRAEWGLGYQPIANFVHRVEMHGVRVYSLVHDGGQIDAFSDWQGDKPYMFLNTVKTAERGRMDASHELGHLTLHAHTGGPSSKLEEDQAQAFASAFLMPAKAVIATMPSRITPNTMIDAKLRWGVSAIAYVHRLWSLGRLSKSAYRSLAIRIRTNPAAEPGPRIQRETSQVLAKVMGQNPAAVRREIVKHLRIPLSNLDEITFGLALTLVAGTIRPIGPTNTSAPSSGRLRLMN